MRALAETRVLERGFRPFFLLASLVPPVSLAWWLAVLHGASPAPGVLAPRDWHVHELLFGFLPGVLAGFLLTALPSWTARAPVAGLPLGMLVSLWLAGRVALLLPGVAAPWAAGAALAFPVALAALAWREVLAGGSRRNRSVCLLVTLLALADAGFLGTRLGSVDAGGAFERLGLAAAAGLMALIGGRVVPAFTRNWMRQRALERLPGEFAAADRVALAALAVALAAWVALPGSPIAALAFTLAGLANAARVARWRGAATVREPLVLILHLGYAWLVAWLFLAAAASAGLLAASVAAHALTTGAVGTMTLAIMTRASLGHGGRALRAGGATVAVYGLVQAGALVRILAPALPVDLLGAYTAAAVLWAGAYALFALSYGPLLIGLGRGPDAD